MTSMKYSTQKTADKTISTVFLVILSVIFMVPVVLVLINSFKSRLSISYEPFSIPRGEQFVGFENYIAGLSSSGFLKAFLRSLFVTVFSVAVLIVCTSMASWFIVRVKNRFTGFIYYVFAFSMIVPFQMVMYTMTYMVKLLCFDNIFGVIFVYLGFGASLSIFMFTGFIKAIPMELEEAAQIDGCTPLETFFKVVFPVLKPTVITVSILNSMWIWNDYLLPYLVLGVRNKTIPIAIQIAMQGAYGATDYGGFMAMLVLAIIPIVIFYICSQKYIIKGVISGAVKG